MNVGAHNTARPLSTFLRYRSTPFCQTRSSSSSSSPSSSSSSSYPPSDTDSSSSSVSSSPSSPSSSDTDSPSSSSSSSSSSSASENLSSTSAPHAPNPTLNIPVGKGSSGLSRTIFIRTEEGKHLISPVHTLTLLAQLAQKFGPIQAFHFPREPQGQRLLGYASITFLDVRSLDKVLRRNNGTHTITLPPIVASRPPRSYLDDQTHAQLVGLNPLTSSKAPGANSPAKQVLLSAGTTQNPSSLRPGWNDVAPLVGMRSSPVEHFVSEDEAKEDTPPEAIIPSDSQFYLDTRPVTVKIKAEHRISALNLRPSPKHQPNPPSRFLQVMVKRKQDQDEPRRETVNQMLRRFGGFQGGVTDYLKALPAMSTPPKSADKVKSTDKVKNEYADDVLIRSNKSKTDIPPKRLYGDSYRKAAEIARLARQKRSFSSTSYVEQDNKARRKAEWQRNRHSNFVDHLVLRVTGGKGGDGCVSFHREKFVQYGPPSGGNGGAGGSIYIRAVQGPTSLARVSRRFRGADGQHGQGSFLHGRKGEDKIIEVPVGTVVTAKKRLRVQEEEEAHEYYDDLLRRAAKSGWDPTGMVAKEDVVVSAERDEIERLGSLINDVDEAETDGSHDNEDANHRKPTEYDIDGEALLDQETAFQLQTLRDRVWRHYPRSEETNYRRNEFRTAEMRLALDRRRRRRSIQSSSTSNNNNPDQSAACVTPYEDEPPSESPSWKIDLDEPTPADSPGFLLAAGGKGGLGNPTFLSSNNRSPKFATRGEWGESLELILDLKRPSDVGLVGLPNAGKSTILRSLSASKAQVGHWRFTTLSPNLGVVRLDEQGKLIGIDGTEVNEGYGEDTTMPANSETTEQGEEFRLVLSDIPGLIDGAAENRGLGHTFLRHIERCSMLAYVLDLTEPEPWADLKVLHNELTSYKPDLAKKAELVIVNKADLFSSTDEVSDAKRKLERIRQQIREIWEDVGSTTTGEEATLWKQKGPMELITVSAKKKQGTDMLAKSLVEILRARAAAAQEEEEEYDDDE